MRIFGGVQCRELAVQSEAAECLREELAACQAELSSALEEAIAAREQAAGGDSPDADAAAAMDAAIEVERLKTELESTRRELGAAGGESQEFKQQLVGMEQKAAIFSLESERCEQEISALAGELARARALAKDSWTVGDACDVEVEGERRSGSVMSLGEAPSAGSGALPIALLYQRCAHRVQSVV